MRRHQKRWAVIFCATAALLLAVTTGPALPSTVTAMYRPGGWIAQGTSQYTDMLPDSDNVVVGGGMTFTFEEVNIEQGDGPVSVFAKQYRTGWSTIVGMESIGPTTDGATQFRVFCAEEESATDQSAVTPQPTPYPFGGDTVMTIRPGMTFGMAVRPRYRSACDLENPAQQMDEYPGYLPAEYVEMECVFWRGDHWEIPAPGSATEPMSFQIPMERWEQSGEVSEMHDGLYVTDATSPADVHVSTTRHLYYEVASRGAERRLLHYCKRPGSDQPATNYWGKEWSEWSGLYLSPIKPWLLDRWTPQDVGVEPASIFQPVRDSPRIGDEAWHLCSGTVHGTACDRCTDLDVAASPDFVCATCVSDLTATGECPERTAWRVIHNPNYVSSPSPLVGAFSSVRAAEESALPVLPLPIGLDPDPRLRLNLIHGTGDRTFVTSRVEGDNGSVAQDVAVNVWQAPQNEQPISILNSPVAPAELIWTGSHPYCAHHLLTSIIPRAQVAVNALFDSECRDDGKPANAFHHAYLLCELAQQCGATAALAWGRAHEYHTGNPCNMATMDLHNDDVGVDLADNGDCERSVVTALLTGKLQYTLREGADDTPPPTGCEQYENSTLPDICIPHPQNP